MGILDLFSKRLKRERGEVPDVYTYDSIPHELRVQIVHIFTEAIGEPTGYEDRVLPLYRDITMALCKEYGVFELPPTTQRRSNDLRAELINFFLQTTDQTRAIDVIEIVFRAIDTVVRQYGFRHDREWEENADAAINELNQRFKEAGVGYQYIDGEIIRVDSELIHSEVTKPALRLLNTKLYQGAHQEFLAAYEHYRSGKNKEALNDCLKAFESTMKSICEKRGWTVDPTATASKLLQVCFDRGLVPSFWQQELSALRSLLESSVPTGRNKLSGHGQGSTPTSVPDYIVAYMLHMTAAALVFLTSAEAEMK